MTTVSDETPRDVGEALADRVWARWRWLILVIALVFALNNFAGMLVGALGAIAFANRVARTQRWFAGWS